jgi:hypothetical protein
MKRKAALGFLVCASLAAAEPPQPAPFSTAVPGAPLPPGWTLTQVPNIPRATRFDLVGDDGGTVLRATADAAAASLTHKLDVDPKATPWLNWRWKVSRVLDRADLTSKAGDDYSARVYVFFDYDIARLSFLQRTQIALAKAFHDVDLPAATLCYVWDNRHPPGTTAWSAYTDRVRMIVVETGQAKVGQWVAETRDVATDFRAAFGEEAPRVTGVALAADTDNTGERVESRFGDLAFLPSRQRPQ